MYELKFEYRISKSETISNTKIQMTETMSPIWLIYHNGFVLIIGTFEIRICFELRALDFEFAGQY